MTDLAQIGGAAADGWLLWFPGTGAIPGNGHAFDAAAFVRQRAVVR
ncbi:MAG: hypothetical protein ACK4GW_14305 [Pseudorhodobacter sp.]